MGFGIGSSRGVGECYLVCPGGVPRDDAPVHDTSRMDVLIARVYSRRTSGPSAVPDGTFVASTKMRTWRGFT
jgi:hypothetical protein